MILGQDFLTTKPYGDDISKAEAGAAARGVRGLIARGQRPPSKTKLRLNAAKKGYAAATNTQANASSGSYIAGAAARKLRNPAILAGTAAGSGAAGVAYGKKKGEGIWKAAPKVNPLTRAVEAAGGKLSRTAEHGYGPKHGPSSITEHRTGGFLLKPRTVETTYGTTRARPKRRVTGGGLTREAKLVTATSGGAAAAVGAGVHDRRKQRVAKNDPFGVKDA